MGSKALFKNDEEQQRNDKAVRDTQQDQTHGSIGYGFRHFLNLL